MSQATVRTRTQTELVTYTRGGGKELEGQYEKPVIVPAADNNDPAFHACLGYTIFRNDTLFAFVQIINITAIVATIILARRSNRICPYHLNPALTARA